MNLKVITTLFIIWIVFLTALILLSRTHRNTMEEKYTHLLEAELDRLPLGTTEEQVLALYPELSTIRHTLDQLFRLNCKVLDMMRNPAPIYCKEMAGEKKRCQQDIKDLSQAVSGLFEAWEASDTSLAR